MTLASELHPTFVLVLFKNINGVNIPFHKIGIKLNVVLVNVVIQEDN
jgi:hypothetical protein